MLVSPRVWAFHNVSMPIKKPVHSPKLVASSDIKAVAVSADRLERLSVPNIPKGQKPPVGMVGNTSELRVPASDSIIPSKMSGWPLGFPVRVAFSDIDRARGRWPPSRRMWRGTDEILTFGSDSSRQAELRPE